MGLLQFFSHLMDDPEFRGKYLNATTTIARLEVLRTYRLTPIQIGLVLREDKSGLASQLSTAIGELDNGLTSPTGDGSSAPQAPDHGPAPIAGGQAPGKSIVFWPGPLAVSVERLNPDTGPAGTDCQLEVRGWHFAQRVMFEFAQPGSNAGSPPVRVKVSPSWVHNEPSGQSWAGIILTLPAKGKWSVAVRNLTGEHPTDDSNLSTTVLPDAFEAT